MDAEKNYDVVLRSKKFCDETEEARLRRDAAFAKWADSAQPLL